MVGSDESCRHNFEHNGWLLNDLKLSYCMKHNTNS